MQYAILRGHRVKDTDDKMRASAGSQLLYVCVDCGLTGTFTQVRGGYDGCPERPDSLGRLSVCPGGERCGTHPDTSSREWAEWKASSSLPATHFPRITCSVDGFAARASAQYLRFADAAGIKMGVWSAQAFKVGPEGGTVAEFTHNGKPWHVNVTPDGLVTAHPGNDHDCDACTPSA